MCVVVLVVDTDTLLLSLASFVDRDCMRTRATASEHESK